MAATAKRATKRARTAAKSATKPLTKKGFKGKQATPEQLKGNQYARKSPQDRFISQMIVSMLNETIDVEDHQDQKKVDYMLRQVYNAASAKEPNMKAVEFLTDRAEGKVPRELNATHEVNHMTRAAIRDLPMEELEALERIQRKALQNQGVKVIDITPDDVH